MGSVQRLNKNERLIDPLGLSYIENGNLFCKSHYVINQVFGHKGFLLDYIASHIEAGIYEEHEDMPYFYHSATKIAEKLNVSRSQVCRWIEYYKKLGILIVKKFGKTFNVNYMTINKKILKEVIESRINIVKRLLSPDRTYPETQELLIVKEEMLIEQIQEQSESLKEIEDEEVETAKTLGFIAESRPKNSFVPTEMVDCWNETFNVHVVLNPILARNLVAAFKAKFHSDIDICRQYFETLLKMKVSRTLEEVMSYRFIDRIMAYQNNGKNKSSKQNEEVEKVKDEDIQKERSKVKESMECILARDKIAQKIGEANYRSWFSLSKFSIHNGMLTIVSPNIFTKSKQIDMYQDMLNNLFGSVKIV